MDERAARVLEAHVQHMLAQLAPETLDARLERAIADGFAWFEEVPLEDAIRREDVKGLIERYALDMRVSGAVSELAGEIARVVLSSESNAQTRVADIIPSDSFEDFADKLANLHAARAQMLSLIARSETLPVVVARAVAHVLRDVLDRAGHRATPSIAGALRQILDRRLWPAAERRASEWLQALLEEHHALFAAQVERHLSSALDAEAWRSIGEEVWQHLSEQWVAEAFAFVGESDLEDFVVLCFEFWLSFRKTPYLRRVIGEAVDFFFDKYSGVGVAEVITEMGVTPLMVTNELKSLSKPLVAQALSSGFAERQIRQFLVDFYDSEGFSRALDPG